VWAACAEARVVVKVAVLTVVDRDVSVVIPGERRSLGPT
jgi:hypothetical protein